MDSVTREIVGALRPGYVTEPVPRRQSRWYVLDPKGAKVTAPDGSPIVLGKAESPKSKQKLLGMLEKGGAVERRRKRTDHEDPRPHPTPATVLQERIPKLMAEQTLRDPKATPRERSLAKGLLELDHKFDEATLIIRRLAANREERERRIAL